MTTLGNTEASATFPATAADVGAPSGSGTSSGTNTGDQTLGTTAAAIGTSAGGAATSISKSDHVHATGAGTPSTQAFGDAAAMGTGPAAAMTDHKHGMPASPATSFVSIAKWGTD